VGVILPEHDPEKELVKEKLAPEEGFM